MADCSGWINPIKMSFTSPEIVEHIFKSEGWPKFTNDPVDKGGATKGGITLVTLREWREDSSASVEDLKELSKTEASNIYDYGYIRKPGFEKIEDGLLRFQVVDCGVLSGSRTAIMWLQEAACVDVDGRLGPITLERVNSSNPHILGVMLVVIRLRFFGRLVAKRSSQSRFISGWINRGTNFLKLEASRLTEES